MELLRTAVLGNVSKLLNEHVWILHVLDGSLGRCKLPINFLNCLSNSLLSIRPRILLLSVQESLYKLVSLPPQICTAKQTHEHLLQVLIADSFVQYFFRYAFVISLLVVVVLCFKFYHSSSSPVQYIHVN